MGKRVGLKEPYIPWAGGQNTISRGYSAPWVGGLTYHRQGIRYIMCRGTKYHKKGGGGVINIPCAYHRYILSRGFEIYTGTDIPLVKGDQNTISRGFNTPWVVGLINH